MSQRTIERVIGRLLTDEELRHEFTRSPRRTLVQLHEQGWELSRLEVTPVVVNGLMFVTASNDAFALDARTGRTVWHHPWPISDGLIDDASSHINRGVAVWHNRLYMETDNAHLLCLDARSGNLIWDVAYASWNKNYGATSAPLIVKDKVLVGTSGGDDGVRGFIAGYDANDPVTAANVGQVPATYTSFLDPDGLRGYYFAYPLLEPLRLPMSRENLEK